MNEKTIKLRAPFGAVIMALAIPTGTGGKEAVLCLRQIVPGVRAFVPNDPTLANNRHTVLMRRFRSRTLSVN
jgi:hypothetical protein